jgi:hypothetical protein
MRRPRSFTAFMMLTHMSSSEASDRSADAESTLDWLPAMVECVETHRAEPSPPV